MADQQQQQQHSFATCYMELCRQQRLRPLPMICVTLPHSLDFTTDRVKMDDWAPILNSLSLDRTLRFFFLSFSLCALGSFSLSLFSAALSAVDVSTRLCICVRVCLLLLGVVECLKGQWKLFRSVVIR